MDEQSRGIRLLIAGGIFVVAGLNMWRRGWFEMTTTAVVAGAILLGGAACLAVGGLYVSKG